MGLRDRRFLSTSSLSSSASNSTLVIQPHPPPPMEAIVIKKFSDKRSRRPTVSGFLPLPPISASPICTPTTSTSSRDFCSSDSSDDKGRPDSLQSHESFATAPTTPSDSSLRAFPAPPPTWISTPPTPPPPKVIKRSVTCMPRRLPSSVTSPTSFSAFMSPHGRAQPTTLLQRCASTSSLPSRRRAASESSTMHHHVPSKGNLNPNNTTSPLRSNFTPSSIPVLLAHSRSPLHDATQHQKQNMLVDHLHDDDPESSDKKSDCEHSLESASTGGSSAEKFSRVSAKDCDRKYHALVELLSTEVSYLQDLRILVSTYLRNVPTLTRIPSTGAFGRNSSFTSISRNSSHTQLYGGMSGTSPIGIDFHGGLQPMTSLQTEKTVARHLFTDMEVEMLTRNAEEVLQFHERFVKELKISMNSLGIPMETADDLRTSNDPIPERLMPGVDNVDAAIAAVSTKFATESSRFSLYQTFCAGHPEALDIIRRVQQTHPTEWDLFEQRCSNSASEHRYDDAHPKPTTSDDIDPFATATPKKRRRASITDQTVRTIRASLTHSGTQSAPARGSRLFFMDYLIKPVQRICKYPLLLDQLKTGRSQRKTSSGPSTVPLNVDVVAESAALAMRHVAGEVDEARRRHDVAARSLLIISRISVSAISTSISSQPLQVLTSSFLSSLGTCLFAGSLDVIHNRSTKHSTNMTSINVKYLGAFLYAGGYLILVKVLKGKIYEPRHWFRLSEFQITDPDEIEGWPLLRASIDGRLSFVFISAWLPCSFRLSTKGYEFELAAACQAEKEAWLAMIQESLTSRISTWVNEPVSSLQLNIPMPEPTLEVQFPTLPTIQSSSELPKADQSESPPPIEHPPDERGPPKRKKLTRNSNSFETAAPSRHSSSASVRSLLSPMVVDANTIIIRRCLPSSRTQIDLGIQDVISDQCLTARSHAAVHEGGLFHAPHISRSGTTRSNSSALSMKKLKRHESVRVDRRSFQEDPRDSKSYASRTRSLSRATAKRPKPLSIASNSSDGQESSNSHNHYMSPSPPFSQCSFHMTNSNPASQDNSPIRDGPFLPPISTSSIRSEQYVRKTRHSLVGSVRSLFLTRSPGASGTEDSPTRHTSSSNLLRRWVKGSHRRINSAPDNKPDFSALKITHRDEPPSLHELDRRAPLQWPQAKAPSE
ncbi:hypothetical protein PQX77_007423 [Marasmius sp. AFHP31]|nr:hypothetical protein PQX77_007423 [Marasmius sp. AFHP31]